MHIIIIIIISMHILVCQELPGYIRFYKELNGVASRHENHLYMCQICATAMLSMIVTNSIELLRSHEIPMYCWKTSSIFWSIWDHLTLLSKRGWLDIKHTCTTSMRTIWKKCQQKKKISNAIIDNPQNPPQKETKICHGWRWHCWFHQCCHNGCFFGTT